MTYPEVKFCSAEHGYFDRNKHIKCPKCAEEDMRDRIREEMKPLRAKNKAKNKKVLALQAENERLEKALKTAKRQMCQLCKDWPVPTDCDRYPCWRITIVNQALSEDKDDGTSKTCY